MLHVRADAAHLGREVNDDVGPGGLVESLGMRLHREVVLPPSRHDDLVVSHAPLAKHTEHCLPQEACASGHNDPFF